MISCRSHGEVLEVAGRKAVGFQRFDHDGAGYRMARPCVVRGSQPSHMIYASALRVRYCKVSGTLADHGILVTHSDRPTSKLLERQSTHSAVSGLVNSVLGH